MSVVLDASMTVAWLFATESTNASHAVLQRIVAEGANVPSLWRLEVANVLRNAVRRGRCDESYADRCFERLRRLRITLDTETDAHAWGQTRRLARDQDLTLYDAAYLELAMRREQPLASCDAALIKAAHAIGLDVLSA